MVAIAAGEMHDIEMRAVAPCAQCCPRVSVWRRGAGGLLAQPHRGNPDRSESTLTGPMQRDARHRGCLRGDWERAEAELERAVHRLTSSRYHQATAAASLAEL